MRSVVLPSFDAPPEFRDDLATPPPGDGELLVRVQASSVNPIDAIVASGMLRGMAEYEFPVVLGRDFAGLVEAVGPGAERFAAGDEVFGFVAPLGPAVRDGSWAELIVVSEQTVAAIPPGVATSIAGATPLAGITALRAVDALELEAGDSVLIVGASGGVGSFAVQLAVLAGADVIATALVDDLHYLRELGARQIVDRNGDVAVAARAEHPDGVDGLIDLVSGTPDAHAVYAAALKPDGRASSPLPSVGPGPRRDAIVAEPDPVALDRLARLLEAGTLSVPIQRSYPLEQAQQALVDLSTTHTQGKLAITIP